ncbi:MAG: 1-deoxy-D-xylulose-5-phosphate synthase [Oceanococcaceae bacterium]
MAANSAHYQLLGRIGSPRELRAMDSTALPELAAEIRRCLVETLGRVGGHFGANLGAVELTIALHRCFNTPQDRLVWDVGHQAYPHKILTGRRGALDTVRKLGGLAPFPTRVESEYDTFGVGHSSTSISAAIGMALASKAQGLKRHCVAVIGDGGMTAGLAFEALNHLGASGADVIVVYNDNDMSISENVGGLRNLSARLVHKLEAAAATQTLRDSGFERPPAPQGDAPHAPEPSHFFSSLGVHYSGPIDGHDLGALEAALTAARERGGPQLVHVLTVKGRGFEPAEAAPIKWHAVTRFDPVTGETPTPSRPKAQTYSDVFGDWLCGVVQRNPRVFGITPAMREGSGMVRFAAEHPERYIDVGIAEQHAVTLAAGMACEGAHPVVAIYSTFLQRGYDQLIHDVALQNLPVLFALDRGGLVGGDGATHHGVFDLSYLRAIPNMVIMAPSDEAECARMLETGVALGGPAAVRYPRGGGNGAEVPEIPRALTVGKARMVREAHGRRRPRVALLSFGCMLDVAKEAGDLLDADVVDMRFVKPLDEAMILDMSNRNDLLVTLEDNAVAGGAGSAVNEVVLAQHDAVRVLNLGLPDAFIEHGEREELLAQAGLDLTGVLNSVRKRLRARDLESPNKLNQNQA